MKIKTSVIKKFVAVLCCMLMLAGLFINTESRPIYAQDNYSANAVYESESNNSREEKFFGKWSGGAWSIEPKINYSYSGLEQVEQYAMLGNYDNAKKALLSYYKQRDNVHAVSPYAETSMAADLLLSNIIAWTFSDYLSYTTVTSKEDWYSFSVLGGVTLGMQVGFELMARGKRDDLAVFSSKEGLYSPYLELNVNGVKEIVYPVKDATVRAGDYRTENYGYNQTLEVNDTGYPADSDSRRAILVFDLSKYSGLVSSANLYVHGETAQSEVEIMAVKHADIAWDENTISYSVANLKVYSWEGNMSAWDWGAPDGCTEQYDRAVLTLEFIYYLTRAFHSTRKADYAQKAIEMLVCVAHAGGDNPRLGDVLRLGNRGETMTNQFGYLVKTPYMTAQDCFDIVYYMWIQGECLGDPLLEYPRYVSDQTYASYAPVSNWGVTQTTGLFYLANFFYEFTGAPAWQPLATSRISDLIDDLINVDGSYNEDCTSYAGVTLTSAFNIVKFAKLNGISLNPSTEMRILKLLEYVMTFCMPDTMDPNYGDATSGSSVEMIKGYVDIYGEEGPLLYYVSRGSMGTEPTYTSQFYPQVRWAIMRSGWDEDDLYMFINTQSGTHNHWDSNATIMYAYGRNLLIDSGRKSYDDIDADTIWQRKNVESHNTLQVDGLAGLAGDFTVNDSKFFATTDLADMYQGYNIQASTTTEHTRTVLMIKDGFYIVSDYATDSVDRTFMLNWHLPVSSNPVTDGANNKTYTTFSTGANLQIVSTGNASIEEKQGVLTLNAIGQALPYPFMKYSYPKSKKLNVSTLLYPTREGDAQDVTMQAIALSDNSPDAQAAVINFDSTRGGNTAYYYLSNESTPLNRSYGAFTANGMLAYTEYDESGNIVRIVYTGGTVLSGGAGEILSSPLKLAFVAAAYEGSTLTLQGNLVPCTDKSKAVKIYAPNIAQVTVNGESVQFEREGDYVYAAMSSEQEDESAIRATIQNLPDLADLTADDGDTVKAARVALLLYEAKGYSADNELSERLLELEKGLEFLAQMKYVEYDLSVLMPDGLTLDTVTTAQKLYAQLNAYADKYENAALFSLYNNLKAKIEGYLNEAEEFTANISQKAHVISYKYSESVAASIIAESSQAGAGQGLNGFYYYYMNTSGGVNPMTVAGGSYTPAGNTSAYWNASGGKSVAAYFVMCGWKAETDCLVQIDFSAWATAFMGGTTIQNGVLVESDGVYMYISRGTMSGGYPCASNGRKLSAASNLLYNEFMHPRENILSNALTYSASFNLRAGEVIWFSTDPVEQTSFDQPQVEINIKVLSGTNTAEEVTAQQAFDAADRIQAALFSLPEPSDVTAADGTWIMQLESDFALFTEPENFYLYDDYVAVRNAYTDLGLSLSGGRYAVTILPCEGGTVTAPDNFIAADTVVTLSVTPQAGYVLVSGSLKINEEPADSVVFVMPEHDVIISAQFQRISYSVSAAEHSGVTVRFSADTGKEGDKIFFAFDLPYGQRIRSGSVKINGQSVDGNYFIMPPNDAVLTYELESILNGGLPAWGIALICIGCVLVVGGASVAAVFVIRKKRVKHD